jgi:hypothetical protein
MFRIDAFGRKIPYHPRLRFLEGEDDNGGGTPKPIELDAAAIKAAKEEKQGFPDDTAPEEMDAEQRASYWKHRSRANETVARSRGDYDDLKAKAERLERLEAESKTEQEKAVDTARREGENIGAQRYLKDAVTARFQMLTGKTDDDTAKAFAHVQAGSFTNESGDIDLDALTEFASTFGLMEKQEDRGDSYTDTIRGTRKAPTGAGSIKAIREQYLEDHPTPSRKA